MPSLTFEGGLNEQDVTLVNPSECVEGYNFELGARNTHFQPRKPFDKLGTATNAAQINGFVQLIKNDDSETTLVQAGDTVYVWDGTTTFTSKGTINASSKIRGTTWTLGGYSVITDISKLTVVKKWDGTTLSTLTTGLGADLYAKYGLVYLNRVWLFNVKSGTDTPHLLVASAFEDPTSYSTSLRNKDSSFSTGNEAFYMTTPDLRPINGAVVFYNTLVVSTEGGRLWKITGSDSTDFAWAPFYAGSSAVGTETMADIGNDVIFMRKDGNVDLLSTTQNFGDVAVDDVSRYIRNTTSGITDAITVYDQERQKVYFFSNVSNKLLVLFKDMLGTNLSPWSVYRTSHTQSFVTSAAIYMRQPGGTDYFVYWGDSVGVIYQMEGTGAGDNGNTAVVTLRKSKFFEPEDVGININLQRLRGRVYYRRVSDVDLLMDFEWGDDYAINRCTVPLDGPSSVDSNYFGGSVYFGGVFYFNKGFELSERVSTKGFSAIGRGPGAYLTTQVSSTLTFDIMKIEV